MLVTLSTAPGAFAAPPQPLGEDGLVALVPPPEIEGDGQTPVTLGYFVLDPAGEPVSGLVGDIQVEGQTVPVAEKRPGVYEAVWTPQATTAARDVAIGIRLEGKRRTLARSDRVSIVPAMPAGALSLTIEPPLLVLGRDTSASVTVRGLPSSTQPDLAVLTSAGRLGPWEASADGWVARYEPPKENYPQVAMIAVVDRMRSTDFAVGTLPLYGNVSFPVRGIPGGSVTLEVGKETFGPVTADETGRARVPIIVPPGVSTGTVRSVFGAEREESQLDLRLPAFQRVALLPSMDAVPADGAAAVPVYALVVDELGQPDADARVTFSATSGNVSQVVHQGNGVYAATYVPSFQTVAGETTLQVAVDDPAAPQGDAMTLRLMPARPESITVDASPSRMSGSGSAIFTVHVTARLGQGAPGKRILLHLEGATSEGAVVPLGGGDYQVRLETTGRSVDAILAAGTDGSPNRASQLLIVPATDRVTADGTTHVGLLVAVVDRFGHPIADQDVAFVIQGGGALLDRSTIHTDASGLGLLTARAGSTVGLVTVAGRAATGLDATASFLQLPPGVEGVAELPVSGTNDRRREHALWRGDLVALRYDATGLHRIGAPKAPDLATTMPITGPRREPSEFPWLRVFGGWSGSSYQYIQAPDEESGLNNELWHDNVYWGSDAPGWAGVSTEGEQPDPAFAPGYALDARAFLPRLPNLGAELGVTQAFYGVELAVADGDGGQTRAGPYNDAPIDVALVAIPRFLAPVGEAQIGSGLRIGGAYQRAIVFLAPEATTADTSACPDGTATTDPCATHIDVWGLSIGAEVSAEVPSLKGFAAFSGDYVAAPWNNAEGASEPTAEMRFQLRLGYRVSDPLYVGLQLFNLRRRINVVAEENAGVPEHVPGILQDQLRSVQLGIGYQR
jgi:hypothetical protein